MLWNLISLIKLFSIISAVFLTLFKRWFKKGKVQSKIVKCYLIQMYSTYSNNSDFQPLTRYDNKEFHQLMGQLFQILLRAWFIESSSHDYFHVLSYTVYLKWFSEITFFSGVIIPLFKFGTYLFQFIFLHCFTSYIQYLVLISSLLILSLLQFSIIQ